MTIERPTFGEWARLTDQQLTQLSEGFSLLHRLYDRLDREQLELREGLAEIDHKIGELTRITSAAYQTQVRELRGER